MKPEAQRIAIGKACGWTHECSMHGAPFGEHPDKPVGMPFPDYLYDLNAMADAEATLGERFDHRIVLYHVVVKPEDQHADHTITWDIVNKLLNATAKQRAEAFLRTKGLWKDDATPGSTPL